MKQKTTCSKNRNFSKKPLFSQYKRFQKHKNDRYPYDNLTKIATKESGKTDKTIHKRDIADQIVETISIEITSLDQIQIEVFGQTK